MNIETELEQEHQRIKDLASDFLGGNESAVVSVEALRSLLLSTALRASQNTLTRVRRDMLEGQSYFSTPPQRRREDLMNTEQL